MQARSSHLGNPPRPALEVISQGESVHCTDVFPVIVNSVLIRPNSCLIVLHNEAVRPDPSARRDDAFIRQIF
jgi:hypothetical protein